MRCLAEYYLKSEATFVDGEEFIRIEDPEKGIVVTLKAGDEEIVEGRCQLRMWVEFEADSLTESQEPAKNAAAAALNMLCLVTSVALEVQHLRYIADWSVDGDIRNALFMQRGPNTEAPHPVLGQHTVRSATALFPLLDDVPTQRAMRWFRLGLVQADNDDRFQCFWLCLETLVPIFKNLEKVPSKCSKCGGALYCEGCGEHPLHKPYPKQVLAEMVTSTVRDDGSLFKRLDAARNALMHGEGVRAVAADDDEYVHLVNSAGRVALQLLLTAARRRAHELKRPDFKLELTVPNSYANFHWRVAAHVQTQLPRDKDGVITQIPDFKITSYLVPAGGTNGGIDWVDGRQPAQD